MDTLAEIYELGLPDMVTSVARVHGYCSYILLAIVKQARAIK